MANRSRSAKSAPSIDPIGEVTGGVDTHRDFHVAAALDALGRVLGTAKFDATTAGYAALGAWLAGFGIPVERVGMEGTGDFGTGLTQHLTGEGITVVEVNRPDRRRRRRDGKSDPTDAINAARAVQSGEATAAPKLRQGPIESVRALSTVRKQLIKARTAAINELKGMLITAPAELREQLSGLPTPRLLAACAALETPPLPARGLRGTARTAARDALAEALCHHTTATRVALATLAETITGHDARIADLDTQLDVLVATIAPRTLAQHGVHTHTAAQLLTTAGDNPDRVHGETAFATLTGVAPIDASSGRTQDHHRLSRAGDRQANSALYRITITRLATCPRTQRYRDERLTPNGSNRKHIIRCLKRYIAREIYPHLIADLTALNA